MVFSSVWGFSAYMQGRVGTTKHWYFGINGIDAACKVQRLLPANQAGMDIYEKLVLFLYGTSLCFYVCLSLILAKDMVFSIT